MYKQHNYYIYIMSSKSSDPALYIGVTSNLERRVCQHKNKVYDGFSKRYSCHKLVYFEHFTDINEAIAREKELKGWKRERKMDLIKTINPNFKELYNKDNFC